MLRILIYTLRNKKQNITSSLQEINNKNNFVIDKLGKTTVCEEEVTWRHSDESNIFLINLEYALLV